MLPVAVPVFLFRRSDRGSFGVCETFVFLHVTLLLVEFKK